VARPDKETAWRDSTDRLRTLYEAERHPLRRQRLQALILLSEGTTVRETAAAVGVSVRTIQRWLAVYREAGVEEAARRVLGHRGGRRGRLTPTQAQELASRIHDGTIPSVHDAIAWVRGRWGVEYTYKGMHSLLTRVLRRR
jgi:transposase